MVGIEGTSAKIYSKMLRITIYRCRAEVTSILSNTAL